MYGSIRVLWSKRTTILTSHINLKMSSDCIFCKICKKELSAEFIYEDDQVVVFKDIKPAAPNHYLCVPLVHIQDVNKLTTEHKSLLEKLIAVGKQVLREKGCDLNDVRLGFHCPPFNSVRHLHLHLIAPASEMSFLSRMIFKPNTWWFATADSVLERIDNNKL